MTVLEPAHWALLLHRIAAGRCVPVLGAAANVEDPARGYRGLPLAADVALALARDAWPDDDELQREVVNASLAEVALAVAEATDRVYLLERLGRLLDDPTVEPSPLLRTLATLPLKLIVTTNYDRLLERALLEADHEPMVVSQDPEGFTQEEVADIELALAEPRGVVVYKLHGSLEGDPPRIVIDEDDYISIMAAIASGRGLPQSLTAQLATSTLLCVGYSARDWDFRMLLRQFARHHRRVYAVMRDPPPFWLRYLERRGFAVIDAHVYDFADELAARWAERN